MQETVQKALEEAISHAPAGYSKLILLVGHSGSGKTRVLQEISKKKQINILNINLEMSRILMELPIHRRDVMAIRIFNDIINNALPDDAESSTSMSNEQIVLLDNLEVLFDKDLKLDPLILLQNVSRNILIIASWNGSYKNNCLTYARTGHPEYRFYDKIDAQIIEIKENVL